MLKVKSFPVELRGVRSECSKKGRQYYILNVETEDGSPEALYCPEYSILPQGLKKGEMIAVTFDVSRYQGNERLVICAVERC